MRVQRCDSDRDSLVHFHGHYPWLERFHDFFDFLLVIQPEWPLIRKLDHPTQWGWQNQHRAVRLSSGYFYRRSIQLVDCLVVRPLCQLDRATEARIVVYQIRHK
jgi:hypothetical protein